MYIKFLWKYMNNSKFKILILFFIATISIAIQIKGVKIIANFIDQVVGTTSSVALFNVALLYIGLLIINIMLDVVITYLSQKIGWKSSNMLREELYSHCLKLDIQFHKEKTEGELIEIIDEDVNVLFNFLSSMSVMLISNTILFFGVMISFYSENFIMGVVETIFSVLVILVILYFKKLGVEIRGKDRVHATQLMGFIGEALDNTEELQGNSANAYAYNKYNDIVKKWLPVKIKANVIRWSSFIGMLFLQVIGYTICFGLGTYLWKLNLITVGTIYLFFNYTLLIINPLQQITQQFQDLQKVGASIERINKFLNNKSTVKSGNEFLSITSNNVLSFKDVSFMYNSETKVLRNINFEIQSGKTLGLIGRTGSGKTTIARLIARLYDINEGEIELNGMNVSKLLLSNFLESIVYITQDIQILNATIRDNLVFYDESILDSEMLLAIRTLGLEGWFSKFVNSLDTEIGIGGEGLSVGEEQLIALIRGFLKNPEIVILDEVTSKLDFATEQYISKAMRILLKDRIGVVIAHRLHTLDEVDDILILSEGSVVEYGSKGLLENNESTHFYKLKNNCSNGGLVFD